MQEQQNLIPLMYHISEWFQDASLEIWIDLQEFLELYVQQYDNVNLLYEVSAFLYYHPELADEILQFSQNTLHQLVSQNLS